MFLLLLRQRRLVASAVVGLLFLELLVALLLLSFAVAGLPSLAIQPLLGFLRLLRHLGPD